MNRLAFSILTASFLATTGLSDARADWQAPDRLSVVPAQCLSARTSDLGHVVWRQNAGAQTTTIVLFQDGTATEITHGAYLDDSPDVNNDGQVVFTRRFEDGNTDVMLYDGGSLVNLSLCPDRRDGAPSINNQGHVVWSSVPAEGGNREIFFYDGTDVSVLSENLDDLDNHSPRINDNDQVVWQADVSTYSDIVLYDPAVGMALPILGALGTAPDINNAGTLVWADDGDIVTRDAAGNWRWLTDTAIAEGTPTISNTGDVAFARGSYWTGDLDAEVLVWNAGTGETTSLALYDDGVGVYTLWVLPQVNDLRQVVWTLLGSWDGDLRAEIYRSRDVNRPPPCGTLSVGGANGSAHGLLQLAVCLSPLGFIGVARIRSRRRRG